MKYIDKPELKKHKFLTGILALTMAFSGGAVLTACDNNKKPVNNEQEKPPIIIETPDPDKKIEEVNAEFEIVRNKIAMADDVTIEFKQGNESVKYEIDGNKMKVTDKNGTKIYEKASDGNFVYSMSAQEWQKDNIANDIPMADECKQRFDAMLDSVKLEKVEDNTITGTMETASGKTNITYSYNNTTDTITISNGTQTVVINNAGATNVKVPTEYNDNTQEKPPVVNQFDPNNPAHIEKLEENLKEATNLLVNMVTPNYDNYKIIQSYLYCKNSQFIDTIGFVMVVNNSTMIHTALTKKVLEKDLSWQDLFQDNAKIEGADALREWTYTRNEMGGELFYGNSINTMQGFDQLDVDKSYKKVFKEDYVTPIWTGWTLGHGPQDDRHTMRLFDGKDIREIVFTVLNDSAQTAPIPAFIKNYLEAEDDSKFTLESKQTIQVLPENVKDQDILLHQTPQQEIEQNL